MFENSYKNKKVLVTGCTGFKGSWLSYWLTLLGADVYGYAVDIPTQPSLFNLLKLEDKIHYTQKDIRDFEALNKTIKTCQPDIIFHLAAIALVRPSYQMPKETFDVNVGGTINALECIRQSNHVKAAVLVTSDKCYINQNWIWGYKETDLLGGKEPYGASKAAAEIAIQAYHHSYFHFPDAPKIASVRAGNVIGGGDWAESRIVPDAARAWTSRHSLLVRHPSYTRPWQFVLEPLSGYLLLGALLLNEKCQLAGEAYNFGPNTLENYSVEQLLNRMKEAWPGFEWKQDEIMPKIREDKLLKLEVSKAWEALKWRSCLTFDETVDLTASWYQNYYTHFDSDECAKICYEQIKLYERLASERNALSSMGITV